MSKLSRRQSSWIYINILTTLLLLVIFGWKVALIEFLSIGLIANVISLVFGGRHDRQ